MRISAFLEDFAVREHARGCTSAGLHSRRVEDNTPGLLGSGSADLGTDAPYLRAEKSSRNSQIFAEARLTRFSSTLLAPVQNIFTLPST